MAASAIVERVEYRPFYTVAIEITNTLCQMNCIPQCLEIYHLSLYQIWNVHAALPRQKEVKDKIKFSNYEAETIFYTDHCLLFNYFFLFKISI